MKEKRNEMLCWVMTILFVILIVVIIINQVSINNLYDKIDDLQLPKKICNEEEIEEVVNVDGWVYKEYTLDHELICTSNVDIKIYEGLNLKIIWSNEIDDSYTGVCIVKSKVKTCEIIYPEVLQ